MKKALLLIATLMFSVAAYAADTKPIEEVFNRYWAGYSKKDLQKAAADILPADLDALKGAVLPVFLANQSPANKDAQELVNLFFNKTVGKAREAMTGADVYAGLHRIVMANNPPMFEALKDAALTIIFVRTPAADEAEVHFQVTIRGESDTDAEQLSKKNGRWWIRMRDDPKETAEQFKQMLTAQAPAASAPPVSVPMKK